MVPAKLPKEVLNLFPNWEYRCPSCGTYVESNISFCPNCKTPFDENKWRVPPRFLKSHDAMSGYAHKMLAHKLTPEQRELLFQYFTELFSDGFESGDFSAWTGTNGTPTIVDNPVHCGSKAAAFNATAEYAYKQLTSTYGTLYLRWYVRWTANPSSGNRFYLGWIGNQGNPLSTRLLLAVYNDGGTIKWSLYDGTAWTDFASPNPTTDTWYCVEMKFDRGNKGHLWVDGDSVGDTANNCQEEDQGNVEVGTYPAPPGTIYIDCVVVADTYIGPETTEQTYTKTWTTDALFKKLGIPKTLGVDTALQKQDVPKTFGLDAAFQKSFIIQNQIDALFKRFDVQKSFAVDARFGTLMTQTISRQIDVLLKRVDATKTFGVDVYFGPVEAETYVEVFALDAIFAYKVRLPELWLDENGKIVLNVSKPYTWVGT